MVSALGPPIPTLVPIVLVYCAMCPIYVQSQRLVYQVECPTKYSLWKQKVELRSYQDLSWRAFFADRPVQLTPVIQPQRARMPMRATG